MTARRYCREVHNPTLFAISSSDVAVLETVRNTLNIGVIHLHVMIEVGFDADAFGRNAGAVQRLAEEMNHSAVSDQVKVIFRQGVTVDQRRNALGDAPLQSVPSGGWMGYGEMPFEVWILAFQILQLTGQAEVRILMKTHIQRQRPRFAFA
jgi:hypothetical protein